MESTVNYFGLLSADMQRANGICGSAENKK